MYHELVIATPPSRIPARVFPVSLHCPISNMGKNEINLYKNYASKGESKNVFTD